MRLWIVLGMGLGVALAHYATPLPDAKIANPTRQFGLPFATAPGPDTWLLAQLYGNTTGAYRQRNSTYRAIQGIHFGLDFAARCGTPVVAIGDGVVSEVDGPHGSPPHNLVIEHSGGLASFYGHLLERSSVKVGQRVKRGQVVGKSGDSQFSCTSAPHLHLEIRDSSHQRLFNPIPYIAADWDTLALVGGMGSRTYQRDLSNPRRWQQPDQQPSARRGGPLLANFSQTWPPAQGTTIPAQLPKQWFAGLRLGEQPRMSQVSLQRITQGGCCVSPQWSPDSNTVLFLDKPSAQSPAALYGVSASSPAKPSALLPIAFYSPDYRYAVVPGNPSLVRRLSDGQTYTLPTRGAGVVWGPQQQLAWNQTATQGNFDQRTSQIWVSALGGTPKALVILYGGGVSGWLDANTLLLSGKTSPSQALRSLMAMDIRSQKLEVLSSANGMRSLSIAPGGQHWVYYVAFDTGGRNGLYVQTRGQAPQKLGWFGAYRWRDAQRLMYIPLQTGVPGHSLREYNLQTQQSRVLLELGHKISNDHWQVSPDGSRVVFLSSLDRNLYVAELPQ